MGLFLSLVAAFLIFVISFDPRIERLCWRLLFLSLSVRISIIYIYTYSTYIGKQNIGIAVTLTDILAAGMLARYMFVRRTRNVLGIKVIGRYVLYVGYIIAGLFFTYNKGMTTNEVGTVIELLIMITLITRYMKAKYVRFLYDAIILNIFFQTCVCIVQAMTGINFRGFDALVIRYGVYRCQGLYITPSELALISMVSFFVLLLNLLSGCRFYYYKKRTYFAMACCLFCIVEGQSRTCFLIMVIGILLLAMFRSEKLAGISKHNLQLVVSTGILVLLFLFAMGKIDLGNSGDMLISRIEMWSMGLKIFMVHPLFGIGANAYTAFNSVFSNSVLLWEKTNPVHNIFIMELAETGIVGFFLLFGNFYFVILKFAYKKRKSNISAEILFIALFVQMLYSFTGWVFYSPSLRFFNMAIFMLLIVMSRIEDGMHTVGDSEYE